MIGSLLEIIVDVGKEAPAYSPSARKSRTAAKAVAADLQTRYHGIRPGQTVYSARQEAGIYA
ncbi:hypothetical protein [Stakelama marina]|uniref:Uncharacterized protein n=1 Tax=Stakelama marina TaxID=2826939 RepID=A0A8T4IGW3_9SPHN|nr:hypothetical protein [Stakelama marina]MBR0552295.1 hypothetical protein [Stakelama marina]